MQLTKIQKKPHVLVTGGAGFIGSELCTRLLTQGTAITILTRHTDSPRAKHLVGRGATILAADFSRTDGLPSTTALPTECHLFIHLAADVAVSSPATWPANLDGTKRALDLAEALNIRRFIFASSIEAQGLGTDGEAPLVEERPCRPVSEYGASKAKAEELVTAWGTQPERQAAILRIGNIYGPGSPWFLQPALLALLGWSPLGHVWNDLASRRFQPLYIRDLGDAMVRVLDHGLVGLYNVTGEESVTVGDYLETLASLTGLTDELARMRTPAGASAKSHVALPADFAYMLMGSSQRRHRSYDNAKLRSEIGPYTRWSLARGLASTLQWYQQCGALSALLRAAPPQGGTA